MSTFARRRTAWIASLAIVLAMLAPSLYSIQSGPNALWSEICTAVGSKLVLAANEQAPEQPAAHGHCPLCLPHATPLAILPASIALHPAPLAGRVHYLVRHDAIPPRSVLLAARARAPPLPA